MSETGARRFDASFDTAKVGDLVAKLISQGTGPALLGGGLTVIFGTIADLFVIPQDDAIAAIITGGLLAILGGLFNLYVYRRDIEIYLIRYKDGSERARRLEQAADTASAGAAALEPPNPH